MPENKPRTIEDIVGWVGPRLAQFELDLRGVTSTAHLEEVLRVANTEFSAALNDAHALGGIAAQPASVTGWACKECKFVNQAKAKECKNCGADRT
jgi:hypothetical protein